MIVGYSTIEDLGAGFRERLFLPRWTVAQEALRGVEFPADIALRVRIVIGHVDRALEVQGSEDQRKFVIESRIPIDEFKQLTIREKNDLVLDVIFESIEATYAHFGEPVPADVGRIWREAREST